MNQPARIAHACWAMLAASLLLLASCDREPQEIALAVSVVQWAQPDMPAEGVKVILEEQRLTNGVVNAFYTAVDEQLTDASGMVELNTERTNVLAMRVRAEKEGCFDEILDISPSSLVTDGTPNPFSLAIMPLCLVQADIDNTNSPCPTTPMLYKWIPREVDGAASDVKWTCSTDWQSSSPGSLEGSTCYITGGTWLLHRRDWSCIDSSMIDSVWCPEGGVVSLLLN